MSASTTVEIRAAFETWSAAWNRGDIEGYLAGYLDSEETRYVSGSTVTMGKTAIAASYRERFTSPAVFGQVAFSHFEVTEITNSDALVFGLVDYQIDDITRIIAMTAYLRKIDGVWYIVAEHSAS
ncbi:MAG: YybH family protein [Aggregatilineales bacterium]